MIIGITGKKGSGKDHAGQLIANHFGFVRRSFAYPFKSKVMDMFSLSEEEYDQFKRQSHVIMGREVHGRDIVRGIGMAMREVNPIFTQQYMDTQIDLHPNIVITDVRFQDEYEYCRSHKGIIIKIVGESNKDDHISEKGFEDSSCDLVVYNDYNKEFDDMLIESISHLLNKENV